MKTNAELRAAARQQLGGNIFSDKWLSGLLATLILGVVASLTSFLVGFFLYGPVMYGVSFFFLMTARNKTDISLSDLSRGFNDGCFSRALVIYLLETLYLFLWSLLIIPVFIKTYSYSMAYYISLDHPEYTANQCITESRRMMNGYKMKAFLLDLSFIGWLILGSLVCGVGTIFVTPYQFAARANLYEAIKAAENGVIEGEVCD